MKKLVLSSVLIISMGFWSCTSNTEDHEAQKLPQIQQEKVSEEQEHLLKTRKSIEGTISEILQLEDSINNTSQQIALSQQALKDEASQLRLDQLELQKEKQLSRLLKLSNTKDSVSQALNQTKESIDKLDEEEKLIVRNREELTLKEDFVSDLGTDVAKELNQGITLTDSKMEELEERKRNMNSQIDFLKQKADLSDQRKLILENEKSIYELQKKDLWADGATQSKLDQITETISELENKILSENSRARIAREEMAIIEDSVRIISSKHNVYAEALRKKYTTQEVLTEYLDKEQIRIKERQSDLDTLALEKLKLKELALEEKTKLEENLTALSLQKENLEGENLAILEKQQKELEGKEALIAQTVSNNAPGSNETLRAEKLSKDFQDLQISLDNEKEALIEKENKLQQPVETSKVNEASTLTKILIFLGILLGSVALLLGGLYAVGKLKSKNPHV